MLPRREKGSNKAKKRKPPARSQFNLAASQKAPPTTLDLLSNPSRTRPLFAPSPSLIPEFDRNVTSQYAREQKRFKLSLASLYDESINESSIAHLVSTALHPNSLSQESWGVSLTQPIEASRRKKTGVTLKRFLQRRTAGPAPNFAEMIKDTRSTRQARTTNTPDTSHLLRLSLELRERVYGHLIRYNKPLMVKPDWQTVERNPYVRHSIVFICKQINEEATAFLYRVNIIHALFRKPAKVFSLFIEQPQIDSRFISSYRNVIMELSEECWNLDWYEKATKSIETLITANAVIACLTLVVVPKRVCSSSTALGMEPNRVTFANFLSYPGDLMISLRKLAPSKFNIVVKKGAAKQLLVSLDLKYLEASNKQQALLRNAEISKILSERENELHAELRSLEGRFEETCEENKWTMRIGACLTPFPSSFLSIDTLEPNDQT